ncbi:MAG: zinc-dependent alcohol dehydrogenase [Chitinophagales bacterium]
MREIRLYPAGDVRVEEAPDAPAVAIRPETTVVVETGYSVLSPGTEGGIIRRVREHGMADLPFFRLGYCAAGRVAAAGSEVAGLAPGQRVACYGGPYVTHSSRLWVPHTLIAPLPDAVSEREAAFAGLGGIAIHGLRVARLQFGESVVLLGLGILGQLAAQVGVAAGYRVFALDLKAERLALAQEAGVERALPAGCDPEEEVKAATGGAGADAVLVFAASKSPEVIAQALRLVRPQGRVVVVGDVDLSLNRDLMFSSEAEVVVSRAAGPGRYDPHHERDGQDYPLGYVRWTEGRNLREFVRLLGLGKISLSPLISDEAPLEDAPSVYERLLCDSSSVMGVLFRHA